VSTGFFGVTTSFGRRARGPSGRCPGPQRPWCKRQRRRERHRETYRLESACSRQSSRWSDGADRGAESLVITKIFDFLTTTAGIETCRQPDCSRLSGRLPGGCIRFKPRKKTSGTFERAPLSRDDETASAPRITWPRNTSPRQKLRASVLSYHGSVRLDRPGRYCPTEVNTFVSNKAV
jgi:hypothetical protein